MRSIVKVQWCQLQCGSYSISVLTGCGKTDEQNNFYYNLLGDSYQGLYTDCSSVYTGKVGLLSVDEVVYAGAYKNNINKKYYLYNSNLEDGYLTKEAYDKIQY